MSGQTHEMPEIPSQKIASHVEYRDGIPTIVVHETPAFARLRERRNELLKDEGPDPATTELAAEVMRLLPDAPLDIVQEVLDDYVGEAILGNTGARIVAEIRARMAGPLGPASCPRCGSMGTERGMADHLREVHGEI